MKKEPKAVRDFFEARTRREPSVAALRKVANGNYFYARESAQVLADKGAWMDSKAGWGAPASARIGKSKPKAKKRARRALTLREWFFGKTSRKRRRKVKHTRSR